MVHPCSPGGPSSPFEAENEDGSQRKLVLLSEETEHWKCQPFNIPVLLKTLLGVNWRKQRNVMFLAPIPVNQTHGENLLLKLANNKEMPAIKEKRL